MVLAEPRSNPAAGDRQPLKNLTVLRTQCAGIDLGSRYMQVCAAVAADAVEVQTYDTTTAQIQNCAAWMKTLGITSVAMESTGVYWIPVFEILESSGFEVLLVDTRPLSRVPGRKTDVIDCQWIQQLHSHGLLSNCFRPAAEIQQIRSLVRAKAKIVAEQSDYLRRIQKELDQMNVRLHHAVSDIQGTTGMAILRAIVAGERDPQQLAALRDPQCRKSQQQVVEYLTGHWRADHLFNLTRYLEIYDTLGQQVATYEREVERRLKDLAGPDRQDLQPPRLRKEKEKGVRRRVQESRWRALYQVAANDLASIDGIGVETAEVILSEYGPDLSMFPTENHFAAHLQLAPRQNISGGKKLRRGKKEHRSNRAGQALRTAATTLIRSSTALGAHFRRIAARKGAGVAVFAAARKMAILVYRMLRYGQPYVDEGQKAYEDRHQALRLSRLQSNAAQFGYRLVKQEQATC